ncbi:MAG: YbbR-like domain-containing protein [bacterium]|nr:YbbR-like domain-containing protein [bacterium]
MRSIFDKLIAMARKGDYLAKAACLLCSVALWLYISTTKTGEVKFRIPINIKNLPAKMIVSKQTRKHVVVVLSGKKEQLSNVEVKNIKPYVSLKRPRVDKLTKYSIQLELVKREFPADVKIALTEKTVDIMVEKKSVKKVKIIPKITGTVKEGCIIGRKKILPEYVEISGAKSVIDKIDYIYTEDVSIDNESSDVVQSVELNKEGFNNNIHIKDTVIKVVVPIMEYGELYSLEVPVIIRNVTSDYRYRVVTPYVKVYMKSSEDKKIVVDDIDAFVNIGPVNVKALMAKMKTVKIRKELPVHIVLKNSVTDVEIVSVTPDKIMLEVEKRE